MAKKEAKKTKWWEYLLSAGIVIAIIVIAQLVSPSTKMSKAELKKSFYNMEDLYATTIIKSQKNKITDKQMIKAADTAKNKIQDEYDKLNNNDSSKDLTDNLQALALDYEKALKVFQKSSNKSKANRYAAKAGKLSQSIAEKNFGGKHSDKLEEMIALLDGDEESSDTVTNDTLSNDSIESAISNQNSSLDIESVNGSYADSDSTVQITLNGREALTDKQTEKGMLMDISDVWKAIQASIDYSKFSNIGVSVKYTLKDASGNTSSDFVIKSDMSGAKLSQLNSSNFDWHNVPTFATSWWQSPALPDL